MGTDLRPLGPRHFTDYELCPQKYHLSALGQAREVAHPVGAPRALHGALVRALQETLLTQANGPAALAGLLDAFEAAFDGAACADTWEEERTRRDGRAILEQYYAAGQLPRFGRVEVAVRFTGDLNGQPVYARADVGAAMVDGGTALVTYHSGRRPPSPAELERDLRTGLLQLLAGEQGRTGPQNGPDAAPAVDRGLAFGPSERLEPALSGPLTCEVHALRGGRVLPATKSDEQLAAVRARALDLIERIRYDHIFPTARGSHCRWCRSKPICPAWQERWGRS